LGSFLRGWLPRLLPALLPIERGALRWFCLRRRYRLRRRYLRRILLPSGRHILPLNGRRLGRLHRRPFGGRRGHLRRRLLPPLLSFDPGRLRAEYLRLGHLLLLLPSRTRPLRPVGGRLRNRILLRRAL